MSSKKNKNKKNKANPQIRNTEVKQESKQDTKQEVAPKVDPVVSDKKPVKGGKKFSVVIVVSIIITVLIVLGVIYLIIADKYKQCFMSNVVINGHNCEGKTPAEVSAILDGASYGYSLDIYGRDPENVDKSIVLETISGQDIDYIFTDSGEIVAEIFEQQNPLEWGLVYIGAVGRQEYVIDLSKTYDYDALVDILKKNDHLNGTKCTKAQDAYISDYDEDNHCYHVVPETMGTEIDLKVVVEAVNQAILEDRDSIDLEELNAYKSSKVTSEDKKLTDPVDEINTWLKTTVKYDWHGFAVDVTSEQIAQWVSIEDGTPVIDEEAIATFLAETSYKYDTMGKNRKFTTTLGITLSLPSGGYGWKVDRTNEKQELMDAIKTGENVVKEPVYLYKAAAKGENDIGDSYVEIDLSNQHLYLYNKGEIVLESDFVSGNVSDGHTTPGGVFGLTYKTRDAVLRGRDYETPVSYWMPFNGNIGMHDATWRRQFGGEIYLTNGSHGCINLPKSKAEEIYGYVSTGFPVICYYYSDPVVNPGEGGVADETVVPEEEGSQE